MKSHIPVSRHTAFFRFAVVLFALYIVIVLWGVLFKCNMNDALLETYESAIEKSVFERVFLHDDLVEWIKLALKGNVFNRCLRDILLNCFLLLPFGWCVMLFSEEQSVKKTALYALLACLFLEVVQLFTFWGSFSLSDLATNTLSGFLGACLFRVTYRPAWERFFTFLFVPLLCLAVPLTLYAAVRTAMHAPFYLDLLTRRF